jgi:hypothetical protein
MLETATKPEDFAGKQKTTKTKSEPQSKVLIVANRNVAKTKVADLSQFVA